jgi:hypothetical protein
MNIKSFERNKFYFLFFTNFETWFFVLIFPNPFLEPILHQLTQSHNFKFVFQSFGIPKKAASFHCLPTVHLAGILITKKIKKCQILRNLTDKQRWAAKLHYAKGPLNVSVAAPTGALFYVVLVSVLLPFIHCSTTNRCLLSV